MERLTYVTENGEVLFHPADLPDDEGMTITQLAENGRYKDLEEIAERLANREQAEEQGLLLRLPCKVGDTVYVIYYIDRHYVIYSHIISKFVIMPYRFPRVQIYFEKENGFLTSDFEGQLNDNLFLTSEEAEAKLKEMEEDITNFNPSSSNPYSFVSTSKPEVEDRIRKENKKGEQEMITMEECPYQLHCGWCTKFDCPCSELTEKGESDGE